MKAKNAKFDCYCQSKNFTAKAVKNKIMPKICQTAKANFSLLNAFEKCQI